MHEIIEQLDQKREQARLGGASAGFGVSSPCLSKGATNG